MVDQECCQASCWEVDSFIIKYLLAMNIIGQSTFQTCVLARLINQTPYPIFSCWIINYVAGLLCVGYRIYLPTNILSGNHEIIYTLKIISTQIAWCNLRFDEIIVISPGRAVGAMRFVKNGNWLFRDLSKNSSASYDAPRISRQECAVWETGICSRENSIGLSLECI